jgi:5-methylcytosine-specific restriction endonuclease McrA
VSPANPRPPQRIKDPEAVKRFRLEHLGEPCELCERRLGIDPHHKVFRSQGGNDEASNLMWLCRACHDGIHIGRLDRYRNG